MHARGFPLCGNECSISCAGYFLPPPIHTSLQRHSYPSSTVSAVRILNNNFPNNKHYFFDGSAYTQQPGVHHLMCGNRIVSHLHERERGSSY